LFQFRQFDFRLGLLLIVFFSPLFFSGCQKDYGVKLFKVSGTVTLDGVPLKGASVQYRPDKSGEVVAPRGGVGYTDDNGKYVMLFRDTRGCPAGKFHVVISTYSEPNGPEKGTARERVPKKYRGQNTILSATVEPGGDNVFDFDLVTK
jgi:hypothetical protein